MEGGNSSDKGGKSGGGGITERSVAPVEHRKRIGGPDRAKPACLPACPDDTRMHRVCCGQAQPNRRACLRTGRGFVLAPMDNGILRLVLPQTER